MQLTPSTAGFSRFEAGVLRDIWNMRIHLATPALFNKACSHLIVHTCTWFPFPWFYRDKHCAPPVCLRNYKQPSNSPFVPIGFVFHNVKMSSLFQVVW